ncbi:MAG TPA: hypothetical protein VFG20_10260 [Planctomycetaceae bacterium]|nr:hypothetical protein [Planctomycetaceae bacterium]
MGIDIGSQSIKIVQLEAGADRLRVCRTVPHANPPSGFHPELWLAEIERTLSCAWSSRNRWWPLPAACVLSMRMMTFRTVEVADSADESAQQQALQDAFNDDSTVSAGTSVTEAWSTHLDGPLHGSRNYALLGVDEHFAEGLAAVLWRGGLDCRILDGPPFALARAIGRSAIEPVAVIDWGDSAMTLTIVVDGRPYYTRILRDCELRALTAAMMRPLDLEAEQCQQLLVAYGFCEIDTGVEPSDMRSVLGELSEPYLHQVQDELRRTWSFLQQLPGQTPKSAILLGGGAAVKRSVEIVREAFPIPIHVWSLPSTAITPSEHDASFAAAYAVAGLLKNR